MCNAAARVLQCATSRPVTCISQCCVPLPGACMQDTVNASRRQQAQCMSSIQYYIVVVLLGSLSWECPCWAVAGLHSLTLLLLLLLCGCLQ
jgi:hypothetical protein